MIPSLCTLRTDRCASIPERGLVLPVVLVLLLVLAFVGLFAARRAATVEEVSNNARVNQIATLAAQHALNYCEAVVIDAQDDTGQFDAAVRQLVQTKNPLTTSPEDPTAIWVQRANWSDSSTVRITAPVTEGEAATLLQGAPPPHCIAEALQSGQFLITARGLSRGASFNADGQLQGGAEVWLQSIITPRVPVRSSEGGYE